MKKLFLTLLIAFVCKLSVNSQTDLFTPGWHIVKTGAQVKVVQGNSKDTHDKLDWHLLSYGHNEVLLVFNFSKDKYYCFDPEGRIVIVKGKAFLQKIDMAGRAAHIIEEVKLGLDATLSVGNNVWLTGFNSTTKTATILLSDGQKADVPQSSIQDLKEYFDIMDKTIEWITVE